jgi:P27 family predicted phage terminase small subunit
MGRRGATQTKRANEPKPDHGARCPAWLDKDAKTVWQHAIRELNAMGMMTKVDTNALARYCRMLVRWKQCDEFVRKYGESFTLTDEAGKIRNRQQHPEVGIINKLGPQLLKLEQEFGLTPAARVRLKLTIAAEDTGGGTDDEDNPLLRLRITG